MLSPLYLLLAIVAVVFVWLLRQTVAVKPWIEQRSVETVLAGASFQVPTAKVGLGVFLGVATSLFALTVCAYFMRMMAGDWRTFVFPSVLWLNTGMLILSDLAMRSARGAVRRSDIERVRLALAAAGFCSLAFLVGQIWAWQQLNASAYFGGTDAGGAIAATPANSFFYLFTALHGAHVLGGLWFWATTTSRAWLSKDAARIRTSVELCTVYWRYLLLVWLVLLALIVPAVAELCRGRFLA
jgi:cytochrome c oxidase subunit 3